RIYREHEGQPGILSKSLALREYFRTVPLYLRAHGRIAGSISETPGAMPVMVEIGIADNNIYTGENPQRAGYMQNKVPVEIRDYWKNRNLWGRARIELLGQSPFRSVDDVPRQTTYKFVSHQGHLSPAYSEVLKIGLGGLQRKVAEHRQA